MGEKYIFFLENNDRILEMHYASCFRCWSPKNKVNFMCVF